MERIPNGVGRVRTNAVKFRIFLGRRKKEKNKRSWKAEKIYFAPMHGFCQPLRWRELSVSRTGFMPGSVPATKL
jgi:hypothetical protein